MTREEAISFLIKDKEQRGNCFISEAVDIAIKALEQEPCEDAISRKRVVEWLENATDDSIEHAIDSNLEFIPPITPQPKTGHWINVGDRTDWYDTVYRCSCCGREIIMPYELRNNLCSDYPYCHCGAKMVEPQEKQCANCNHYGKLSLDCGRCDDDCSMFEPQERNNKD